MINSFGLILAILFYVLLVSFFFLPFVEFIMTLLHFFFLSSCLEYIHTIYILLVGLFNYRYILKHI